MKSYFLTTLIQYKFLLVLRGLDDELFTRPFEFPGQLTTEAVFEDMGVFLSQQRRSCFVMGSPLSHVQVQIRGWRASVKNCFVSAFSVLQKHHEILNFNYQCKRWENALSHAEEKAGETSLDAKSLKIRSIAAMLIGPVPSGILEESMCSSLAWGPSALESPGDLLRFRANLHKKTYILNYECRIFWFCLEICICHNPTRCFWLTGKLKNHHSWPTL